MYLRSRARSSRRLAKARRVWPPVRGLMRGLPSGLVPRADGGGEPYTGGELCTRADELRDASLSCHFPATAAAALARGVLPRARTTAPPPRANRDEHCRALDHLRGRDVALVRGRAWREDERAAVSTIEWGFAPRRGGAK